MMAVDLSIQVFSHELLITIFRDHRIVSNEPLPKAVYEKICCGYKGKIHCNNNIVDAVYCRIALFHDAYRLQFEYADIVSYDSPSDFLSYMCSTFSSEEFQWLTVFEQIFATCAFVAEMCLYCFYKGNTLPLDNAHICWAMYFDTELKFNFYKNGGWNILKSVARSYISPFSVVKTSMDYSAISFKRSGIHTASLQKLITGIEDFYDFQTFSDDEDNQTRAKLWVNFRLNKKTSKKSTRAKFDTKTIEGLEHFLMCLKYACDPLGDMVLDFDALSRNEKMFSNNNFSENEDFANITEKLSDCNTSSFSIPSDSCTDVPETIELPKAIQSFSDAVHAVALEVQAMTPVGDKSQDGNSCDDLNKGILSIYDLWKVSMNVCDVKTAVFHAPVFLKDKFRYERVASNTIFDATKSQQSDQNKKIKSPISINSLKCSNGSKSKNKKKRTSAEHENLPVIEQSTNNTSDSKIYSDDTKDILRRVLVLGCRPGYNCVRSTLNESTKTTSFN